MLARRRTSIATTAVARKLLTHHGQANAAANGYVPLPSPVQQLARTMLRQVTGPTGTDLLR
jgi:hypothetical protein